MREKKKQERETLRALDVAGDYKKPEVRRDSRQENEDRTPQDKRLERGELALFSLDTVPEFRLTTILFRRTNSA